MSHSEETSMLRTLHDALLKNVTRNESRCLGMKWREYLDSSEGR
jgi:hypothetical protein